ncbi:MAG: DEAD/DEAH box helicase, partial [Candidatus Margulisiibacteriota bacterium]
MGKVYMRQFKEYLEDEGLPANEERIEFVLPVVKNLGKKDLKIIRLEEGVDFKKQGAKPTLGPPDEHLIKNRIVLDWYPKIQALASSRGQGPLQVSKPHEEHFTEK